MDSPLGVMDFEWELEEEGRNGRGAAFRGRMLTAIDLLCPHCDSDRSLGTTTTPESEAGRTAQEEAGGSPALENCPAHRVRKAYM